LAKFLKKLANFFLFIGEQAVEWSANFC